MNKDNTVIYNIFECIAYEGCDKSTSSFSDEERKEMYDFLHHLLKFNDKTVSKLAEEHCKELKELGCEFNTQERTIIIDTFKSAVNLALNCYDEKIEP